MAELSFFKIFDLVKFYNSFHSKTFKKYENYYSWLASQNLKQFIKMWLKQIKHLTDYANTHKHRVQNFDSLFYHSRIHLFTI